jgi:hypothetical protein
MRFFKTRFFRLLKKCILFIVIVLALYLVISRDARKSLRVYFSTSCIGYKQAQYSKKLTDRIIDYSQQAKLSGIRECKNEREIHQRVSEGALVKIKSGKRFTVEKLSYSYPYLTKGGKSLLDEIGKRFREKTEQSGLTGARFVVTSMTRTTEKMKVLRRNNGNASANSPHLNGNAFDISYIRFSCKKLIITSCDKRFMKEALAGVIWELKSENKCWATYEVQQSCFHVVSRQ